MFPKKIRNRIEKATTTGVAETVAISSEVRKSTQSKSIEVDRQQERTPNFEEKQPPPQGAARTKKSLQPLQPPGSRKKFQLPRWSQQEAIIGRKLKGNQGSCRGFCDVYQSADDWMFRKGIV